MNAGRTAALAIQTLPGYREYDLAVNGTSLHVIEAGPPDGEAVLLLHGFPEFAHSYRFQVPVLVQAGYRVIVPNQRGYYRSGKQGPFDVLTLIHDLSALLDDLGIQSCILGGHDWGGAVAWAMAAYFPSRVHRLIIFNAPHPNALADTLRRYPIQILRSLYVLFFQIPWLPERLIRANDYRMIESVFRSVRAPYMTEADILAYKTAIREPGALTAALNWYRAALRHPRSRRLRGQTLPVYQPTLVIWGLHDPYLDRAINRFLPRYVPNLRLEKLPDANHWVMMDQPEQVNRLLLEFLGERDMQRDGTGY